MEIQVHRVSTDQKAKLVQPVAGVNQVPTENPDDPVHQVSTETRVLKVTQDPRGFQEPQVKAFQDHQVHQVSTVSQVHVVTMANQVQKVSQVHRVHRVKEAPVVQVTLKLFVQTRAQPAPPVHQAHQV